ncbi:MAG: hypothetical protein HY532_03115 [Chloroflexi bacterium]|nr:hypothetical protein [Chloroflexota bacterium]
MKELGPGSRVFQEALDGLAQQYDATAREPGVAVRFAFWQRTAGAAGRDLFLRHTYLATLTRLIAYLHLQPGRAPTEADLGGVLRGDYFADHLGLPYFVEEDCFVWPYPGPADAEGLVQARRLLHILQEIAPHSLTPDALLALAIAVAGTEGSEPAPPSREILEADSYRKALVPRSGFGNALADAIQSKKIALAHEGLPPTDILLHILDTVAGMDTDPLAVAVARTVCLLALGDLLDVPRGDVTIPVFLADAQRPPQAINAPPNGEPAYALEVGIQPAITVYVPRSLALDPTGLDYLLPFMKGKYARAVLRAKNDTMLGRAWYSFHNFLVTGVTSRKPVALTEPEAAVMVETQQALVELTRRGQDSFWYTVLRNALRGVGLGASWGQT